MNDLFNHQNIKLDLLKKRAFNLRWAEVDEGVIPLTAADPDFPIAQEIRDEVTNYVQSGVLSYGPHEGLSDFKKVIAKVMNERKKINCLENQILPCNGAAQAMFVISKFALSPQDEAIIFDPVDFLFKTSVEAAQGVARTLPLNRKGEFDLDQLKGLVNSKTKMICICNPVNPLGVSLKKEQLLEIANIAIEHDLWIMSDEIWSDIVYKPFEHISMASLGPEIAKRTLSVFGFSKTFALAGFRVGFIVAPDSDVYERIVEVSKVRTTAFGVSTVSQIAAMAAYEKCWYWADHFVDHLQRMRDFVVIRLNQMKGLSCATPESTYLAFPEVSGTGLDEVSLAQFLKEKAKVSVVPGEAKWFGPGAQNHIRICFASSYEILSEAMDRMEKALETL